MRSKGTESKHCDHHVLLIKTCSYLIIGGKHPQHLLWIPSKTPRVTREADDMMTMMVSPRSSVPSNYLIRNVNTAPVHSTPTAATILRRGSDKRSLITVLIELIEWIINSHLSFSQREKLKKQSVNISYEGHDHWSICQALFLQIFDRFHIKFHIRVAKIFALITAPMQGSAVHLH